MQSSCSTEPTLEAKCAIAKDQKNAAVEAMYNDAAEKIRSSWAPDVGKREGVLRTVCSAPGSLDTSLSHAAGLIEIAACHA